MKIVVTGATGYLGSRLCCALADAGHAVRAFSLRAAGGGDRDDGVLPASVEMAYGDVADAESLAVALDGCDAVFHVAAAVQAWLPDPSVFITINVGGLENVLTVARRTPTIKKIIYTSSYFAIGPTDGYVADERQENQRKTFCTEYEKSKFLADQIALQAAAEGMPITIVYPGFMYGPGRLTGGNLVSRILIERFNGRLPGYIGHGHDRESFCHVDGVVTGHVAAMEKGRTGERYLLTGENKSLVQIFDMAARITKTKAPKFHVPLWLLEIYGWISVLVSRITGKLPFISYPGVRVLKHQWAYSCEKAKRELGYNPRNLTEGLSETLLNTAQSGSRSPEPWCFVVKSRVRTHEDNSIAWFIEWLLSGGGGGMRVVVTGATGYLGGRLCAALAGAGHAVRAFARRSSDASGLPSSVELAYGDVTDEASLAAAFDGCDAVFHVAAAVEPWLPDPSVFTTVNVGGLKNVLEAAKRTPTVKKIIYTSSFFAIGPTDGYVADETQKHQEKTFCTEYEKSKVLADRIALQAAAEGVPITIVYPGVIYGPGKLTTGNLVSRILIERFNGRLPGYIGDGYDRESFCHVNDVVNGHIAALEKGRVGERYLLTGENLSFKHIFNMAANITNTKAPLFHVPLWLIEVYGWISVFVSHITGKLPFISYPTVHVLRHQWAYSCDKAKRELGYSPRNLTEGLSEMLLWLKDEKLIKF
uniref:NAD-dependent epimerase/dehydratase domain-containing protein n=1 Tax=Leersia perrieri TaxID=77586 RepID=A0A0D9VQE8_9ORYZ